MRSILLFFAALMLHALPASAAQQVLVGAFSAGDLAGWEEKSFKGHTEYQLVRDKDLTMLQASTDGMASGRFRKIRIDLTKTPVLHWSWKIEAPYRDIDESTRGGDDFPVRVYVVVERGPLGLRTRAMNYVWSAARPVGARWPNPFTSQAMMLAVDSGDTGAGAWVSHKRNVRDDLRAAFGEDVTRIDAVALMTDGDNGGRRARAWYGDIFFSEQ
jgi:hypothetical protein